MATKIRLQRHGKKGKAFYHIVVADARSPRDGKFIERLGSYNPNTNPATIVLDFDKAVSWIATGATPTDTTKSILSYKGVLYRNHLNGGITKGALTEEQANEKFAAWVESKDAKIQAKKDGLSSTKEATKKTALEAETKKKEAMAAAVAIKNTPPVEEVAEEEVVAEEATEEAVAEEAPVTEAPAKEETPAPAVEEAPKAEAPAKEETPAPAVEEAPKAEAKIEEPPATEEKADEAPKA